MSRFGRGHTGFLLLAVAVAYANAVPAAFQFDDYNVIVDNPAVHSLAAWLQSMPGIRPLLKLSYALNWTSDAGASGFHIVNIALHLLNACLVYALIETVMKTGTGADRDQAQTLALMTALIFALHPAQTEAVTYVSGRSVSLMASAYLASALVWARDPELRRSQIASAVLFASALAAKETAWTLPLALLLLGHAAGRRFRQSSSTLPFHAFVLAAFAVAVIVLPGYRRLILNSIGIRTLGENLLTQIEGVSYLLVQPLLLLRTNIDPDIAVPQGVSVLVGIKGLALLTVIVTGIVLFRRAPLYGVAILWTFVHLLPTNSVFPRLDVANDRQLYLPLLGPALLAALGLRKLRPHPLPAIAGAALVVVLTASTFVRNHQYRDELSLWMATVERSPNKPRAWNNLGYAYRLAGENDAARRAYLRALAIDPDYEKAIYNLSALPEGAALR